MIHIVFVLISMFALHYIYLQRANYITVKLSFFTKLVTYICRLNGRLARVDACRAACVLGDRTRRDSGLVAPSPVIVSGDPVAFPSPKDPAS